MRTLLFLSIIGLFGPILGPGQCRAQCTGNQLTTTLSNLASQYGQYITADCTGNLINFNYQVAAGGSLVTLEVRSGTGCSGELMRAITFTEGLFNSVNFSPALAVTEGQTYSFIIINSAQINVKMNTNSGYQTGGLLLGTTCQSYPAANSWDMVFSYAIVAALPVEMVGFSARLEAENIRLNWQTASETNNLGFEVQRSGDGFYWQKIGFENGSGTTTDRHDYSFLDEKPLAGLGFYRLRQMGFDGKGDFSNIETAETAAGHGFSVFPNPPLADELTILFDEKMQGENALIRLFNATGQLVRSTGLSHTMDVGGLPPGIYSLEMGGFVQKIIVQ